MKHLFIALVLGLLQHCYSYRPEPASDSEKHPVRERDHYPTYKPDDGLEYNGKDDYKDESNNAKPKEEKDEKSEKGYFFYRPYRGRELFDLQENDGKDHVSKDSNDDHKEWIKEYSAKKIHEPKYQSGDDEYESSVDAKEVEKIPRYGYQKSSSYPKKQKEAELEAPEELVDSIAKKSNTNSRRSYMNPEKYDYQRDEKLDHGDRDYYKKQIYYPPSEEYVDGRYYDTRNPYDSKERRDYEIKPYPSPSRGRHDPENNGEEFRGGKTRGASYYHEYDKKQKSYPDSQPQIKKFQSYKEQHIENPVDSYGGNGQKYGRNEMIDSTFKKYEPLKQNYGKSSSKPFAYFKPDYNYGGQSYGFVYEPKSFERKFQYDLDMKARMLSEHEKKLADVYKTHMENYRQFLGAPPQDKHGNIGNFGLYERSERSEDHYKNTHDRSHIYKVPT